MDARLKSLLTLGGLGALLLLAASWGLSALTEPFPGDEDSVCVDQSYAAGDRLRRADVTVSVLNSGSRNGLAGLTLNLFEEAGFARGQEGNVSGNTEVSNVQIWTDDRSNPAVRLVASQLGGDVKIVRRETTTAGVQVVVGDGFDDLVAGKKSVKVTLDADVCGPASSTG